MGTRPESSRVKILIIIYILISLGITGRLFYWQVIAQNSLAVLADQQHQTASQLPASRGELLATDGFPLVQNKPIYTLFAYTKDIDSNTEHIAESLSPILAKINTSTQPINQADVDTLIKLTQASISAKLNQEKQWIPLDRQITQQQKDAIEQLGISGLGFDEYQTREYPESSMAAQLIGFVGSDGTGSPKGYFGLEGYYDFELRGKPGAIFQEKDALGRPIPIGDYNRVNSIPGHTIHTHIHRGLQFLVEKELEDAIHQYGASKGEVIIMNPKTGAILTIASLPAYDPADYKSFSQEMFKVPAIADTYEPGSTFKTIVMSAAIDAGVIGPNTRCDATCNGPVNISGYSISTWNDEYNPNQTMTEVLEHSDNTGMIYAMRQLGKDKFLSYLNDFGFNSATGIDLQSETVPAHRQKWSEIDLATGSFGQGLAVTSIQMVSAVAAIANQGERMQPQVADFISTYEGIQEIHPKSLGQVINPKTADIMVKMMARSAQHGEAQWAVPKGYEIAGKTGTAQIPIAGHYDQDRTIASFIGFAPASDPAFVMLVKLTEPTSSPWASETAAPLWFNLTKKIFPLLNISIN